MKNHSNYHNNNVNPVIISEADYNTLSKLIGHPNGTESNFSLWHELNRAIVVKKEAFPAHAIGINSKVSVQEVDTGVTKTFTLVVPSGADIKKGMISVLSPMGTALIGFREGEYVSWEMPGGLKKFRIISVKNEVC